MDKTEEQIYNINLIVKDYIRTLKLARIKSKNPVVILLVGIPAAGKSYLAKNLVANLPFILISENDIQAFLVPRMSFFERGQTIITEFARKVIRNLASQGFSSVFDANLKSVAERDKFRQEIEKVGGITILIYLNCPKNVAFERIKKRNSQIISGESEGFVLDLDYFHYEINTTQAPLRREHALTFDSSKPDHQLEKIVSYLKKKVS